MANLHWLFVLGRVFWMRPSDAYSLSRSAKGLLGFQKTYESSLAAAKRWRFIPKRSNRVAFLYLYGLTAFFVPMHLRYLLQPELFRVDFFGLLQPGFEVLLGVWLSEYVPEIDMVEIRTIDSVSKQSGLVVVARFLA